MSKMVNNGERLPLAIDGVYTGIAGVQTYPDNIVKAAFIPPRRFRAPDVTANRALLDGVEYRLVSVAESNITVGVYVATLEALS